MLCSQTLSHAMLITVGNGARHRWKWKQTMLCRANGVKLTQQFTNVVVVIKEPFNEEIECLKEIKEQETAEQNIMTTSELFLMWKSYSSSSRTLFMEGCNWNLAGDDIRFTKKPSTILSMSSRMDAGKRVEIDAEENLSVTIRDYGRGIPQGKLVVHRANSILEENTTRRSRSLSV